MVIAYPGIAKLKKVLGVLVLLEGAWLLYKVLK